MKLASIWKSAILSASIVLTSVAFSFAASAFVDSQPNDISTACVVIDDQEQVGKKTFISPLKYPKERTAVFSYPLGVREADEETSTRTSIFWTIDWTLFFTGFFICAWWFQRLVPPLAR